MNILLIRTWFRPLLCLLLLSAFCATSGAVEIIAHRGASHDAPENTMAAFNLGWKQKSDAVELDIWQAKDGRIIVIHDENTKRTTGVDKKVGEQTFEELRKLDAGSWKDAKFKGEQLATLEDALKTIPKGKRLVIEIKCGPEVLPELERVLKASKRKDAELLIITFKNEVARQAKVRFPNIENFWLYGWKKDEKTKQAMTPDEIIKEAKALKVDGINLSFKGPIDADFVKKTKAAGLKFYVWTVDEVDVAKKLLDAGVDGITTNRPQWLREQLGL